MDLTDEQWKLVETILPEDPVRDDGRGRPWSDRRKVLNGVLWILRTGAPWQDLPPRYGPYQTAHRRFQNWVRSGVIEKVLLELAKDLQEAGASDTPGVAVSGGLVGVYRHVRAMEPSDADVEDARAQCSAEVAGHRDSERSDCGEILLCDRGRR